jgi:hypothetical protein
MNEVEQECIILNSVWEMIDGVVNDCMGRDFASPEEG